MAIIILPEILALFICYFRCVTYNKQSDAVVAIICLNRFEILNKSSINVKFEDNKMIKTLINEVERIQNLWERSESMNFPEQTKSSDLCKTLKYQMKYCLVTAFNVI